MKKPQLKCIRPAHSANGNLKQRCNHITLLAADACSWLTPNHTPHPAASRCDVRSRQLGQLKRETAGEPGSESLGAAANSIARDRERKRVAQGWLDHTHTINGHLHDRRNSSVLSRAHAWNRTDGSAGDLTRYIPAQPEGIRVPCGEIHISVRLTFGIGNHTQLERSYKQPYKTRITME